MDIIYCWWPLKPWKQLIVYRRFYSKISSYHELHPISVIYWSHIFYLEQDIWKFKFWQISMEKLYLCLEGIALYKEDTKRLSKKVLYLFAKEKHSQRWKRLLFFFTFTFCASGGLELNRVTKPELWCLYAYRKVLSWWF